MPTHPKARQVGDPIPDKIRIYPNGSIKPTGKGSFEEYCKRWYEITKEIRPHSLNPDGSISIMLSSIEMQTLIESRASIPHCA